MGRHRRGKLVVQESVVSLRLDFCNQRVGRAECRLRKESARISRGRRASRQRRRRSRHRRGLCACGNTKETFYLPIRVLRRVDIEIRLASFDFVEDIRHRQVPHRRENPDDGSIRLRRGGIDVENNASVRAVDMHSGDRAGEIRIIESDDG